MTEDKPIPAKIILSLRDTSYSGEIFFSLFPSLYSLGLILDEPRELRRVNDDIICIVTFSDHHSFRSWYDHENIVKHWHGKFSEYLITKPQTIEEKGVAIEVDKIVNCTCSETEFYLLDGRRMTFTGGLYCGKCLGNIPNSRIPREIELEHWLRNFERVYRIWLDSGVLEKWALNELTNYQHGELNAEGRRLQKELEETLKKPVYLKYYEEELGTHTNCLICGNTGIDSGLKRPKKLCADCRTAFDYSGA